MRKKIPLEKEVEVIQLLRQPGANYRDAVNFLKDKYGLEVTTMAICKMVKRTKDFFTPEFLVGQMEENRIVETNIASSLNATLEIAMGMYEEMIRELKVKRDDNTWKKGDLITFNMISDRLMRLRQIMFPSISVERKISLTNKDLNKEYK